MIDLTNQIVDRGPVTIDELEPLQLRADLDDVTVQRYADAMEDGAEFPPITVVREDGRMLLADGGHRAEAARLAGVEELSALIYDGDRRMALWIAAGANAKHGLPLSRADKRAITQQLLDDEEWQELSDRAIARHVGVSHTYVSRLRRRSESEEPAAAVEASVHQTVEVQEEQEIPDDQQETDDGDDGEMDHEALDLIDYHDQQGHWLVRIQMTASNRLDRYRYSYEIDTPAGRSGTMEELEIDTPAGRSGTMEELNVGFGEGIARVLRHAAVFITSARVHQFTRQRFFDAILDAANRWAIDPSAIISRLTVPATSHSDEQRLDLEESAAPEHEELPEPVAREQRWREALAGVLECDPCLVDHLSEIDAIRLALQVGIPDTHRPWESCRGWYRDGWEDEELIRGEFGRRITDQVIAILSSRDDDLIAQLPSIDRLLVMYGCDIPEPAGDDR